jgi:adenylate cyclase
MPKEIERKFLARIDDEWLNAPSAHIIQGYLSRGKKTTIRIRLKDKKAFITIKGEVVNLTRDEYEYPIPYDDAYEMLEKLADKPYIEKYRHYFQYENNLWEVDRFLNDNEGLIVAELELKDENESFDLPDWIIKEVTGDPRYNNSALVANPFNKWK